MKKLIFAITALMTLSFCSKGQTITTYTLTPHQVSGVNVSTGFSTSGGFYNDYPTNSIFPVFSKDSMTVAFFSTSDMTNSIMAHKDSIIHFHTGAQQFTTRKSIDSFFICCMVK